MPYDEDKDLTNITTKGTTPEIKERIIKKQKEFTAQQVGDMSSELTKANRKLRSGIFTQAQYKEERERIFKKYDITKDERIRFLGKKFAN